MGQEIDDTQFRPQDFAAFEQALARETRLLEQWLDEGRFTEERNIAGFELEAWLVDPQGKPAPLNERYIALAGDQQVVPELARFNIELNTTPQPLGGATLSTMHRQLAHTWDECRHIATRLDAELAMIGILPTVRPGELTLANMSPVKRYRALNEQILRLRGGQPLHLNICGRQSLALNHGDVMLEAAATSFQIHLQIGVDQAVRYYNAAHILSAPMVAVSANSPYLFGHDLWDETRIPLFEQAVEVAGSQRGICGGQGRVTFGSAYLRDSICESFQRNRDCYPVLLPSRLETAAEELAYLRLHNGTLWRWNRPLIGFDEEGEPHLRLEHRVVPAGPTVVDTIANAALFYGMIEALGSRPAPPEQQLDFEQARHNFYSAARYGLAARIHWPDVGEVEIAQLLLRQLLPLARGGLEQLDIDHADIDLYLGIIEARLRKKQNGAAWQRAYIARHGRDFPAMTRAYLERQKSGNPVHDWTL